MVQSLPTSAKFLAIIWSIEGHSIPDNVKKQLLTVITYNEHSVFKAFLGFGGNIYLIYNFT